MERAYQQILHESNTATEEVTSAPFSPDPAATTVQVYIYSDDAGTLDVDVLMSDGRWREVNSSSVTAATLLVVNLNWSPPRIRARFTPDAGTGAAVIDAGFSGAPGG